MKSATYPAALFVPATKLPRLNAGIVEHADRIIVDLEDAVSEDDKDQARVNLVQYIAHHPEARIVVRVNSSASAHFPHDLSVCRNHAEITAIMLPKVEKPGDCDPLRPLNVPIIALIESALGLQNLPRICERTDVFQLALGLLDLSLSTNLVDDTAEELFFHNQARAAVVSASAAYALDPPLEGVFPTLFDDEGMQRHARRARNFGFGGVMCIHPSQIDVVKSAFAPTEDEIQWAHRIVDAMNDGDGVLTVDGKMVDAPILAKASQILRSVATLEAPQ